MRRLILALCAGLLAPAGASEIAAGLSQDAVEITSTYSGTDLVVFGAVTQALSRSGWPGDRAANAAGDIVVVVRGPMGDITVRRKARLAGIWLNQDSARLVGMPEYYYVAGTRDLPQIVPALERQLYDLGLNQQYPTAVRSDEPVEPFRQALLRQMLARKLYGEDGHGVERLGAGLFRVHVPLPAAAPHGRYDVEVYLFRQGQMIGHQSTPLYVDQTGFDRRMFRLAHRLPIAYGVCAVAMAGLLGWLGSLLFRRRY